MTEMTPDERARLEQNVSTAPPKPQGLSPRAVISGLVALVLLAAVGGFGYREFRLHALKQKLAEAIGRDLGLTATILKLEVDSGKITFGDAFKSPSSATKDD
jgi:hypothetical protein